MSDPGFFGLAVTTIGRPNLRRLLTSAAESSTPPAVVAIANQSGRPLDQLLELDCQAFDIRIVESSGGASAGRNDAVRALAGEADFLAFPNDDSTYDPKCLQQVAEMFNSPAAPAAVVGLGIEPAGPRFALPPEGSRYDRNTIWAALEWTAFVRADAFAGVGGFRTDLGTGCPTPWQSGEITDLLLRMLQRGAPIVSAPAAHVFGEGERRDLSDVELAAKHRRYGRGTGHLYRIHRYPWHRRAGLVVMPWLKLDKIGVRSAAALSLGRLEGLAGKTIGDRQLRASRR